VISSDTFAFPILSSFTYIGPLELFPLFTDVLLTFKSICSLCVLLSIVLTVKSSSSVLYSSTSSLLLILSNPVCFYLGHCCFSPLEVKFWHFYIFPILCNI
jgi:hypothetical protein